VAVIVRPHPKSLDPWDGQQIDEPGRVRLWPREGGEPRDEHQKRDYFDTLHHCRAVVGINTSVLVEAAILRRPVLTLVSERFATQEGTLHFGYLVGEAGPVTVGRSWEEHLDQLASAIHAPDADAPRLDAFVRSFVRPQGRDRAAAPLAVDVIEEAAATPIPAPRPVPLRGLLVAMGPLLARATQKSGKNKRKSGKTKRGRAAKSPELGALSTRRAR
jgi:hypothetical protein